MNKVIYRNVTYWGRSTTIVLDDGYGYVMVSIVRDNPECAAIHDLCVHRTKRRQGLGTILLNEACKEAGRMGAKVINLSCNPNWLQKWYEKNGFKTVRVDDRDLMGYHKNAIMTKHI